MKSKTLKSIVVVLLLISVSFNYVQYKNKLDTNGVFEEHEQVLKTKIYSLEEEMWDYENENKNLALDMESYKYIFDHLVEDRHDIHTQAVLRSTYSFESSITYGDETIAISPAGIVYITGDSFIFDASIIKPPTLNVQVVNDLLGQYDLLPITRLIYFPLADNFEISDNSLHLEYNNLVVGDVIKILPNDAFKYNFGINSKRIEIHVVDENEILKGSDYFPSKPVKNHYAASYAPEVEISYDYYEFGDTSKDGTYSFNHYLEPFSFDVSDGSVTQIATPGSSSNMLRGDNLLPEKVLLGYVWENDPFSTVITDLDVSISTPAGDFNCIEVTYYHEANEVSKSYYSQGVGLIKDIDDFGYLELIKIEDSEI